jgi:peroxiredoxin
VTLSIALFSAAMILLALISLMRRRGAVPSIKVPAPVAIGLLVAISVVVFQASLKAWQDPHEEAVKRRTLATETIPQVIDTLPPGSPFPEIPSAGWLYGAPNPRVGEPSRLRVVDVWSLWCPMVTRMAPGMVKLHERYASNGVDFIGVSDDDQKTSSIYAERFKMRWPLAYGIPKNKIQSFGVLRPDLPGEKPYIAPTLYLLGADGRVLWSDGGGRFHHRDTGKNLAELDREIGKALARQRSTVDAQAEDRNSS